VRFPVENWPHLGNCDKPGTEHQPGTSLLRRPNINIS